MKNKTEGRCWSLETERQGIPPTDGTQTQRDRRTGWLKTKKEGTSSVCNSLSLWHPPRRNWFMFRRRECKRSDAAVWSRLDNFFAKRRKFDEGGLGCLLQFPLDKRVGHGRRCVSCWYGRPISHCRPSFHALFLGCVAISYSRNKKNIA